MKEENVLTSISQTSLCHNLNPPHPPWVVMMQEQLTGRVERLFGWHWAGNPLSWPGWMASRSLRKPLPVFGNSKWLSENWMWVS